MRFKSIEIIKLKVIKPNGETKEYKFKLNSFTSTFYDDLFKTILTPDQNLLGELIQVQGLTTSGQVGGQTNTISKSFTAQVRTLRITVSCVIPWNVNDALYRVRVNAQRTGTNQVITYVDMTLPTLVGAPSGSQIQINADIQLLVSNITNEGALAGASINLLNMFQWIGRRLTGQTTTKYYINRARFESYSPPAQLEIPLNTDASRYRIYRENYQAQSTINNIMFLHLDGFSGQGYLNGFITYQWESSVGRPSIAQGDPITIDIVFSYT